MRHRSSKFGNILMFFKMTVRDRYLGSALGSLWAVLSPLSLLAIYTFVFGFVLKARAPGATTTLSYAIWLISGYGPWQGTIESITTSSYSVTSAAGLIKNLPIETEALPIAGALVGIIPLTVSLVFLTILLTLDGGYISWHVLSLIPVIAVHFAFLAALGLWLAPVMVFSRDFGFVLPNILTVLMFATPVVYPIESMPHFLQGITRFNPFYIIIHAYRDPLMYHQLPSVLPLVYVAGLALVLYAAGVRIFRSLKGYFEAVL